MNVIVNLDPDKPLWQLTVGEVVTLFNGLTETLKESLNAVKQQPQADYDADAYVNDLAGIQSLIGGSKSTASRAAKGYLKPAIEKTSARHFRVNVRVANELIKAYNNRQTTNNTQAQ